MSRKFKVDEVLAEMGAEDRAAYDALLRDPATTVDDRFAFFIDRGFKVSRGAVWKHGKDFNEMLEGVKRAAEMARAFTQVAREGGGSSSADISEAALGRFQQLLMQKLFQMSAEEGDEGIDSGELMKLSIALRGAVSAKQQIEDLKAEFATRQKAAVEAATAAAAKGAGGAAVVDTIKRALGITGGAA